MIALLGMLRTTVIPHPTYNFRMPSALHKAVNVLPNVVFRGVEEEESKPGTVAVDLGRSSSSVCIVLFSHYRLGTGQGCTRLRNMRLLIPRDVAIIR